MTDSWYDTALISANGHVVNRSIRSSPTLNSQSCDRCGAPTTTACEHCNSPIRGYYHVPGVFGFPDYERPGFCHDRGRPYSWTEAALAAGKEPADLPDGLTQEARKLLKRDLDDIGRDTPRASAAATRFKAPTVWARSTAAGGFRAILVDIASETAKKLIWPS